MWLQKDNTSRTFLADLLNVCQVTDEHMSTCLSYVQSHDTEPLLGTGQRSRSLHDALHSLAGLHLIHRESYPTSVNMIKFIDSTPPGTE